MEQSMSHNWGRRNRLRKRKSRMISSVYQNSPCKSLRVIRLFNKDRRRVPEWNALNRAWVGFVIAKNQCDCEKMRKYAIVIRKFERRLNIEINDFPEIGIYGFEEEFENKEEDDDSRLTVIDPWK